MRGIIKTIFINLLVLYVVSQTFQGMIFKNGSQTFILAGLALAVSSIIVKPLINIMILPINLMTFGLFRWLSSAIALYIVTIIIPEFNISNFQYSGYSSMWFDIPAVNVSGIFAIILYSLAISTAATFLHWLLK